METKNALTQVLNLSHVQGLQYYWSPSMFQPYHFLRDPQWIFPNHFLHTKNDIDNVTSHVTPRNEIEHTPRNEVEVGPTWWDVLDFWTVYTETEMTTNLFTPHNEVEVWYFIVSDFLYVNWKHVAYKPVHPQGWSWGMIFFIFRLYLRKLKTLCLQTCSPPRMKLRYGVFYFQSFST